MSISEVIIHLRNINSPAKLTEGYKIYMNYQNQRSRYGKFMFNITLRAAKFLMNHMWLYYILNYTWGIITTAIGWIVFGFVSLFLHKSIKEKSKFGPCHYLLFGNNWGGLELGINFFVADNMGSSWTHHTKCHECGHTFQNAIWGPLAIFLIYIPSYIRYWLDRAGKISSEYNAIWFEGNASTLGEIYYEKIK